MELKELIESRINDLINESIKNNYLTSTKFLSLSEQNYALEKIKKENYYNNEIDIILFGGNLESDRKKIYFIPKFYNYNIEDIKTLKDIVILKIEPKNNKFSDLISHRDVLGSLMNLNYNRNLFGDIIIKDNISYVYIEKDISEDIKNNLTMIKHTSIKTSIYDISSLDLKLNFKEILINVSSLRIDSVIKEVFKISRIDSQNLINNDFVFINGNLINNQSYILKENDRVSVKSKGKFIYLNIKNKSKKDRLFLNIKLYS